MKTRTPPTSSSQPAGLPPRRVVGDLHLRPAAGHGDAAAEVHRLHAVHPLLPQPLGDLPVAEHLRPRPRRDRHEIGDVIEVAVRHENRVAGDVVRLHAGRRALVEERVDEQRSLPRVDEPGGVSGPGEIDRHRERLREMERQRGSLRTAGAGAGRTRRL
jgi:hypothetical protein